MSNEQIENNSMAFWPHQANTRLLIKKLVGKSLDWTNWGTVKAVNKESWTCTVEFDDGGVYERDDIFLQAAEVESGEKTGFVIIPKVGSVVLVLRLDRTEWFTVAATTEVEMLYMMGDKYGTVKAEELVTELNKLKGTVDAIVSAVSSWIPVVNDGGGALKTALTSALTGQTTGSFNNTLINDKIRHGQ